jgi:hypothetical protein
MPYRYNYPRIGDSQVRATAGGDPAPTRGGIWGVTGPTGTDPDFDCKNFNRLRVTLRITNGSTGATGPTESPTGTAEVTVWHRDIVEKTLSGDRVQNPPTPADVLWVKDSEWVGVTMGHLEEFIINTAQKRGTYIQVGATGGTGAGEIEIYIAPYDLSRPYESI